MGILNPTETRLSPHFLLSDLMGCASVYRLGLPNVFYKQPGNDPRLANGKALCHNALEPILALVGPVSVSYGFISQQVSEEIVTYQDPRKPSHHMWNLGAAADILPHNWVQGAHGGINETTAPIEFALRHMQDLPLSRLISYSESPYLCVAVSSEEVQGNAARMAWYENRYEGKRGAKPNYRKYPTEASRAKALALLEREGLAFAWEGVGHPTYHGGGTRQFQHIRASRYTMVIDWLYDQEWVTEGVRNIPDLGNPRVLEAFHIAGAVYDALIEATGLPRFSIVSGYTSPKSAGWVKNHDWRGDVIEFELVPPAYKTPKDVILTMLFGKWPKGTTFQEDPERLILRVERAAWQK